MEIPVVMATTAQSPCCARSQVRRAVFRNRGQIIRADILAPLPNVAGHIVKAELVRLLHRYVMNPRGPAAKQTKAADHRPAQ